MIRTTLGNPSVQTCLSQPLLK
ncbi:hypothetical protein Gotri_011087 [Gossypium trilobum]|uniref:Uncharacterized protein n=1 Tax=Gossypium trilobum TaxID=34281 RepID=A0A7J9ESJ8_9ROSI|nr:hypothetical protein [Gossypium trilobum]